MNDVLFTQVIQKDGALSFHNFIQETGKVVAQKKQGDLITITIEIKETVPRPNKQYQSFIFEQKLLQYRNGHRKLIGIHVGLSMKRLSWTFRGKSYRITKEGLSIKKIGR
jgi:hypothetical protein